MKELPFSRESEEAVLGAALINRNILDEIPLEIDDFFLVRHQMIYSAMRSMPSSDVDIITVIEMLKRRGHLEEIGGQAFIMSLPNKSPNSYHIDAHVQIIQDTAVRRRAIEIANDLANAAYSMKDSIGDNISLVVSELAGAIRVGEGAEHISKFLKDLYEEAEERAEDPKRIYGLETGLADFDRITCGLQKGEQFILAGAPGTGKSLLSFQLACGMAEHGHCGAVYELEMRGVAVVRRRVSAVSKIKTRTIQSGFGLNNSWEDFAKAIESMDNLPIYLSERSDWTTMQIRADLSRLKSQYGVEWFVVDYLGKLTDRYGSGDLERLTYVSSQLASIAKDLDLAGLTLQSVTKEGYTNPSMKNVSGPTAIHHDADQIAVLVEGEEDNTVELRWEKQRESDEEGILSLVNVPGFPAFECKARERDIEVNDWWNN
jgi:replicative DNA helicase